MSRRANIIWFLIALIGFIADRTIKKWFLEHPEFSQDVFVNFLGFKFEKNPGIAFGVPVHPVLLLVLVTGVIIFLVYLLKQFLFKKDDLSAGAIMLILAGAFSNIFDRIQHGYVVDYIDVPWFTVFNLADTMITVGIGLMLYKEIILDKRKKIE